MIARALCSSLLLVACAIPERHVDERVDSAAGTPGTLGSAGGNSLTYTEPITRVPGAVVVSAPPQVTTGFGSSLAAAARGEGALVWVGGAPLLSTFAELDLVPSSAGELDVLVVPTPPVSPGELFLTRSPAALPVDPTLDASDPHAGEPCFAAGALGGLLPLYCRAALFSLKPPPRLADLLKFSFANAQPTSVCFGSEPSGSDLLVTADEEREAWYYASPKDAAVTLTAPANDLSGLRKTTTILQLTGPRLLALGLPSQGRVLFWRVTNGAPTFWGCWQGDAGYGTAIAAGQLQPLPSFPRSLVVASGSAVHVYNGKILLDPEAGCVAPPLPVVSHTCEQQLGSACQDSQFGAALAVGDLDGDEWDELVIGAPQLRLGQGAASPIADGGVFVVGGRERTFVQKQLDPPLHGGELGTSLALASVEGRRIIVAGAPKAGKVIFFH